MLGNFAFGDYHKQESLSWALELLDRYGIDRKRLWVTVFETDDETHRLWRGMGQPEERIQRLGRRDNYWEVTGLGGPSSEMFYDRGSRYGVEGGPEVNPERYLEIWNLVFIGERDVDGGMGLDRMALVLQGVDNLQELDPLLPKVRELTGRDDAPKSHRVITDHLRTALVLAQNGVVPGNNGPGYVLRRLLRRAMHHLHRLGVTEPAIGELTGDTVLQGEEERFMRTLRVGERLLHKELDRHRPDRRRYRVPIARHIRLPVELTEEIARESGVDVDREGFDDLMAEHRRRSRWLTEPKVVGGSQSS
jgi:alanyl-tRNA synthetase